MPARFLCDFDGIAYPVVTAIGAQPRGAGLTLDNCLEWETPIRVVGERHWQETLDRALSYPVMRQVGLYPDFAPSISRLAEAGVVPLVRTHRSQERTNDAKRILADYGLDWLSVEQMTPEEKISYCLEEDIRVIVDDYPETIARAHEVGVTALSLRFPYNQKVIDALGVENAPDWATLEGMLLTALNQRYGD